VKTSVRHTIKLNNLCRSFSPFRTLAALPIVSSNPSIEITINVTFCVVYLQVTNLFFSLFNGSLDRGVSSTAAASSSLRSTGASNVVQSDLQDTHSSSLETAVGSLLGLSSKCSLSRSAFQAIKRTKWKCSGLILQRHLNMKLANITESGDPTYEDAFGEAYSCLRKDERGKFQWTSIWMVSHCPTVRASKATDWMRRLVGFWCR
jgi:hypothetical protein